MTRALSQDPRCKRGRRQHLAPDRDYPMSTYGSWYRSVPSSSVSPAGCDREQFGGKPPIVRQLELTDLMRLETMPAPDALHRTDADADVASHCDRGPVGGFTGCCGLRGRNDAGLDFSPEWWDARRSSLVAQQAGDAFGQEPLLPPRPRSCSCRCGG
jgi:hypothetical protein